MSIVTPRLDTSLPSTPSHEWAKDTMNTANIRAQQQQPQSNNPYFNGTAGAIPSNDPVKEDQAVKTTTNAVPHATNPFAPSVNSTASTPGGDVPGSYPRGAEEGSADYAPSQLLESAKQYIPDPNQAQSTLQSMGQTAISYLPASLSGYLPGGQQTSLPSTEKEGIQPGEHQSGIGALPGSINEEGVAKLPEEQARSSQNTRPDMQWTDSNGKGSWGEGGLHKGDEKVADKALQSIGAGAGAAGIAAGVGHENAAQGTSLPSQETSIDPADPKTFTSTKGVGALPGRASEQGVSQLPDERNNSEPLSNDLGIKNRGTQATKVDETDQGWSDMKKSAAAPALAEKARHESTPSPEDAAAKKAKAEEKRAAALSSRSADHKPSDDSTGYHPAADQPIDKSTPATKEADTVGGHGHQAGSTEKTQASRDPDPKTGEGAISALGGGSDSHEAEEPQKKKVGMMAKVKGEVQVLMGKATRKEEKVEEGRKLKEGRAD